MKWSHKRRDGGSPVGWRTQDGWDAHLLLTALAILLLSTLDAIFTLLLIEAGVVTEGNPFMAILIEADIHLFAQTKTALTAGGVVARWRVGWWWSVRWRGGARCDCRRRSG